MNECDKPQNPLRGGSDLGLDTKGMVLVEEWRLHDLTENERCFRALWAVLGKIPFFRTLCNYVIDRENRR